MFLRRLARLSHVVGPGRRLCARSEVDVEKELMGIKREMGGFFTRGNYTAALEQAELLQSRVKVLMGTDNVSEQSKGSSEPS